MSQKDSHKTLKTRNTEDEIVLLLKDGKNKIVQPKFCRFLFGMLLILLPA